MNMRAGRACLDGRNINAQSVEDLKTTKSKRNVSCSRCQISNKPHQPHQHNLNCGNRQLVPTKSLAERSQATQLQMRISNRSPQIVSDYFLDILEYSFRRQESPKSAIIRADKLAARMDLQRRTGIMDVYINICDVLECNRSLFMGSYYFDRALEMLCRSKQHARMDIQNTIDLASIAAFFMSFKLCEIYPPDLEDTLEVLQISSSLIPKILQLESDLLKHIDFATNRNCEDYFLSLFAYVLRLTEQQQQDCLALLEYGILCNHVLDVQPSLRAAGAIFLMYEGMSHYSHSSFDLNMLLYVSSYSEKELKRCARLYLTSLRQCRIKNLSSIKEKYLARRQQHLGWIRNIKEV